MKRYRLLLCLLIASIVFNACKKDPEIPGSISVKLTATTFYKNGSEETKFERSGTLEKTSYGQSVVEAGINNFLVNLGAFGDAPNLSSFGIRFLFNQQPNPELISGTYTFPSDQLVIRTDFRNEITQTVTENLSFPTRGKVSFQYDRNSRKISGSIETLEFSIIPNDPYDRYRVTINGTFKNVPLK